MSDIVERLEEHATDWDGQPMPDAEPAKGDPTAGLLREAARNIRLERTLRDNLARANTEAAAEIERLRAALREIADNDSYYGADAWDAGYEAGLRANAETAREALGDAP